MSPKDLKTWQLNPIRLPVCFIGVETKKFFNEFLATLFPTELIIVLVPNPLSIT